MKKIVQYIIILAVIAAPSLLKAQEKKPYEMLVNGVKVIVQPSGNDIVVVQTVIKGGVQNYPDFIAQRALKARYLFIQWAS